MSDPEIRHAMQLIGIEVERANSLFPNDESEAVCELLRRSHENPDLKKGMLFMCALNVIREGREKRVWLARFSSGRSRRHLRGYAGAVSINNDGAFDIGGFHDPDPC
jgi:hypothetical protein